MGSSAPKSETVVKGGKPTIVREWLSPDYLKELSKLASYYGNRALQERSTYQDMVNTQRTSQGEVALFPTMTTSEGTTVTPGIVSSPYDTSSLVKAAEESKMFQPPKATESKKKSENSSSRNLYNKAIQSKNLGSVKTNELYGYNTDLGR